jgi:hypothetical protein
VPSWWRSLPLAPTFAWIALAPVALDHIVFLKYALHEFAVLKASFFLCVFAAIGLKAVRMGFVVATVACVLGVGMFYLFNRTGAIAQNGERYDAQLQLGRTIAAQAEERDVVFITLSVPRDPMVIYYAHRNVQRVKDDQEAKAFLKVRGQRDGVLFDVRGGRLSARRISSGP